jgi:hypothetical protein
VKNGRELQWVKLEFLGVDERPDDVFETAAGVVSVSFNVADCDFEFIGGGFAGEDPAVDFANAVFRERLASVASRAVRALSRAILSWISRPLSRCRL